jgi:hypothetical protein
MTGGRHRKKYVLQPGRTRGEPQIAAGRLRRSALETRAVVNHAAETSCGDGLQIDRRKLRTYAQRFVDELDLGSVLEVHGVFIEGSACGGVALSAGGLRQSIERNA